MLLLMCVVCVAKRSDPSSMRGRKIEVYYGFGTELFQ